MYIIEALISYFPNILRWKFHLNAGHGGANHATNHPPNSAPPVIVQPIAVPSIPVDELNEITKSFSNEVLVGEGSFARVYHGTLRTGQESALKKLDTSNQPDQEFLAQVCWSFLFICMFSVESGGFLIQRSTGIHGVKVATWECRSAAWLLCWWKSASSCLWVCSQGIPSWYPTWYKLIASYDSLFNKHKFHSLQFGLDWSIPTSIYCMNRYMDHPYFEQFDLVQ